MDIPEPRVKSMFVRIFVHAEHSEDKVSRKSQTGILMFCNKASVMCSRKKQNLVHTLKFGSELTAMNQDMDMTQALGYKLIIFEVPIDRPANMY